MPITEIIRSEEAVIGLWKMTESEAELLELLQDASQYQSQLDKFVSAKRRIEFLSVRAMLGQLLPQAPLIAYLPSGKPYLLDSSYQLSISHTNGYAVLILHPYKPVAIDIEQRATKVMRLKSKFMSDAELEAVDPSDPLSNTLICWSAKETLFKMIDQSAIDFKKHLALSPFRVSPSGCFDGFFLKDGEQRSFKLHFRSTSAFVLTWAIG